jgi:hypothetical protein
LPYNNITQEKTKKNPRNPKSYLLSPPFPPPQKKQAKEKDIKRERVTPRKNKLLLLLLLSKIEVSLQFINQEIKWR